MADNAKVRHDQWGWWVYVEYQGRRDRIGRYLGQVKIDSERMAYKCADTINSEIDRGVYRPERWKRKEQIKLTVSGYSESWLDRIEPGISGATIHDYRNSFRNHINPLIGHEFLEELNPSKLVTLQNSIQRAPKGIKNVMDALKHMLRAACDDGYIPKLPSPWPKQTGKLTVIKRKIKWLEPSEQFAILENIRQAHRPIFTFITLTGCRPSEARAFRKVDVEKTQIVFEKTFGRGEELKEVKGKKIMPFPLTESLQELFDSMPRTLSPWMFPNPETGDHYSRFINRIFNRAARRAGIDISLNEFGRKSFAMQMLNSGEIEKGAVSHLLRHSDPRMIDHYAEYRTAPLKSAIDKVQRLKQGGYNETNKKG